MPLVVVIPHRLIWVGPFPIRLHDRAAERAFVRGLCSAWLSPLPVETQR